MEDVLISKVKENDQEAFEELLDINSKMIYSIVQKHELVYGDYLISMEDLFQEGSLGLLDAAKKFDTNGKASFSTFAYKIIKRRINKYYFALAENLKDECYSYSKYDNIDRTLNVATNYVSDNPISYLNEKEAQNEWDKKLLQFCEFDRNIIKLKVQGYTYKEMAAILKVSEKKIDNRIQKIRKNYYKQKKEEELLS